MSMDPNHPYIHNALKGAMSSETIKNVCQHMNTMNIIAAGYNLINDVTHQRGRFAPRESLKNLQPPPPMCEIRLSPFCTDIQRNEIRNHKYLKTFFQNQMGVEVEFHGDPKYNAQTLIYDEKRKVLKLFDKII